MTFKGFTAVNKIKMKELIYDQNRSPQNSGRDARDTITSAEQED
jgi:hypothetical protein